jgi:hypothetical protein
MSTARPHCARRLAAGAVLTIAVSVGLTGIATPAEAVAPRGACEVSDPSPSPLNVRTGPWGTILRKLKDDTVVWRTGKSAEDDEGRLWVQVALKKNGRPIGWVFREYISCRA